MANYCSEPLKFLKKFKWMHVKGHKEAKRKKWVTGDSGCKKYLKNVQHI